MDINATSILVVTRSQILKTKFRTADIVLSYFYITCEEEERLRVLERYTLNC